MTPTIIARIAAAAAFGFREASGQIEPRTVHQWVAHCRKSAYDAADDLRRNPPLIEQKPTTLKRLIHQMERDFPTPGGAPGREEDEYLEGADLEAACRKAAAMAYRGVMPLLTSRTATRAYIACVAAGTQDGHLTAAEGKTLLYNAQLALAAYKSEPGARRKGRSRA